MCFPRAMRDSEWSTKDRRDLLLNQREPEFDSAFDGAIAAATDDFVPVSYTHLDVYKRQYQV